MRPSLLLIGLGGLGSVLLERLIREPCLERIVVGVRRPQEAARRANVARLGALAEGHRPSIALLPLDLRRPDQVAEVVARESPDIVLSTASLQTWWLPERLPPEPAARLRRAGFGPWLPIHLPLTLRLMRSLREARFQGLSLTAPFPDVINVILGRLGLAPTCGVGNVAELVPKVALLASRRLGVPEEALRIYLVAHHALLAAAFADGGRQEGQPALPPHYLRVEVEGRDVTEEAGGQALLVSPLPLASGPSTHFLTAATVVPLVRALTAEGPTLLHAPGPGGLPGGYPVLADQFAVRPAPIPGLALEEAVSLNEAAHEFDGIRRIEADGSVIFEPHAVEILRGELGYECSRLSPDEAEGRADELMSRFGVYAARHGISLEDP